MARSQLEKALGVPGGVLTTSQLARLQSTEKDYERKRLRDKMLKQAREKKPKAQKRPQRASKKPSSTLAPKTSPRPRARPLRGSESVYREKITSRRLSDTKGGRGNGLAEMARRAIDRAESASEKSKIKRKAAELGKKEGRVPGRAIAIAFRNWLSGKGPTDPTAVMKAQTGMAKGGVVKGTTRGCKGRKSGSPRGRK